LKINTKKQLKLKTKVKKSKYIWKR